MWRNLMLMLMLMQFCAMGTTFLCNAIEKEVKYCCFTTRSSVHLRQMIFDIKMEDLCHKAEFIAGGHVTKAPATLMPVRCVERLCVLPYCYQC
eukprot:CCRYP_000076-RA/>CCRYP_000076-RA protein AED:0.36 eAED:0.34 QI:0/0/0/1/0/0/2/0/92